MARSLPLILLVFLCVCADLFAREARPQRVLWEVPVDRFAGRPRELVPAGDKLLVFAGGVLYALDAKTGAECWHYPEKGAAYRDPGIIPVFILKVLGDEIVTRLPDREGAIGQGCAALSLKDGSRIRTFRYKDFNRSSADDDYLTDTQLVMFDYGQEKKTEVRVFDVKKWAEVARFTLPKAAGSLRAQGGKVFGAFDDSDPERCFTVDLKKGMLYTSPLRTQHSIHRCGVVTPDGRRCTLDGIFSVTYAYLGVESEKDVFADPCVPIWPRQRFLYQDVEARNDQFIAKAMETFVYLADAKTGTRRAVIRVLDDPGEEQHPELNSAKLAVDDERVYFGWSTGLRAYGTWPVDPKRPDPNDPADPAYALARTRAKLAKGDLDGALLALQGIGELLRFRPSQREEAAALLSQLSRLPVARFSPARWQNLMGNDGWVAGELFLDEFAKPPGLHPNLASLLRIGTPAALKIAAQFVEGLETGFPQDGHAVRFAMEAVARLGGKPPWERVLEKAPWTVEALFLQPVDEPTFQALLPKLREIRNKPGFSKGFFEYVRYLPSEQLLTWINDQVDGDDKSLRRIVEAAKAHVASRQRGEGDREKIEIQRPAGTKPEDF